MLFRFFPKSASDRRLLPDEIGLKTADGAVTDILVGSKRTENADLPKSLIGRVHTPIVVGDAIGTAAKTTTTAEPEANTIVFIKFTNGNSAETPTVNFNGAGARAIKLGGTASTAAKCTIAANGIAGFFFDGTTLHQLGVYS